MKTSACRTPSHWNRGNAYRGLVVFDRFSLFYLILPLCTVTAHLWSADTMAISSGRSRAGELDESFGAARGNVGRAFGTIYSPALAVQSDGGMISIRGADDAGLETVVVRLRNKMADDPAFAPALLTGTNHQVTSLLCDRLDRIVIAAGFDAVNGVPRPGVARLTRNGALDPSFQPALTPVHPGGLTLPRTFASLLPDEELMIVRLTPEGKGPGAAILAPSTIVSDPSDRLLFVPKPGELGDLYASFSFTANDGELDSQPGTLEVRVGTPFAATQSATEITLSSATLGGMATPNGPETVAWFEWGMGTDYGQSTDRTRVGSGDRVVRVDARIDNLLAHQIHHARLVVSNAAGVVRGADHSFITGGKIATWPASEPLPAGATNIVAVASGSAHSLALRTDGKLVAWSSNPKGKIVGETNVPPMLTNVVAVAAGENHNLALRNDGTVAAWGNNDYGETNVTPGLTDVIAISTASRYNLALRRGGTVVAWGHGEWGEATVPTGLSNVVAIAAGGNSSLALRNDGTVVAWGYRTNVPAGLSGVVSVASGNSCNYAVRSDGTVVAWGDNFFGERDVPAGLSNVVAVTRGAYHSVALRSDGTLAAWGWNSSAQANGATMLRNVVAISARGDQTVSLGGNAAPFATAQILSGPANHELIATLSGSDLNGDPVSFRITALPAAGTLYQVVNGARGVAIVAPHTIVADPGGHVVFVPAPGGFGSPYTTFSFTTNDGELDSEPATVTARVGMTHAVTQPAWAVTRTLNGMALPGFPSLAWFEWGTTTAYGQATPPISLNASASVVSVSAVLDHLLAGQAYHARLVVSNATGLVFGSDQQFITFDPQPPAFTGGKVFASDACRLSWDDQRDDGCQGPRPPALSNIVAIAAGFLHNLTLQSNGTVFEGLTNIAAVAAGYHTVALRIDGTVVEFGGDFQSNVPAGLSQVVAIAAGASYSLALRKDGTVVAWRYDGAGETIVPVGLSHVVAVAAGYSHNLALRDDGTVVAWGDNLVGQATVPADLKDVVAIAAGNMHNLALRKDGTVVAWGHNNFGKATVPPGLRNVVAVAAGSDSSLALRSDGTVVAWGSNTKVPPRSSKVVAIAARESNLTLGANTAPAAPPQSLSARTNTDLPITLCGCDLNGDPLSFRITTLPADGILYQFEDGARGAAIVAPNTAVADLLGRVIFRPAPDSLGNSQAGFRFIANDGEFDSVPGTIMISVRPLPIAPEIATSSWNSDDGFILRFSGSTTSIYRLWTSTNLLEWGVVGSAVQTEPGRFEFRSPATSDPTRFYKVSTP